MWFIPVILLSINTPVLSVTRSYRNHSNMLIKKKIFLSVLKCCLIFYFFFVKTFVLGHIVQKENERCVYHLLCMFMSFSTICRQLVLRYIYLLVSIPQRRLHTDKTWEVKQQLGLRKQVSLTQGAMATLTVYSKCKWGRHRADHEYTETRATLASVIRCASLQTLHFI